jgi:GAF domain-containing protein
LASLDRADEFRKRFRSRLLSKVLADIVNLAGADKANIQLFDPSTGVLTIEAHCGFAAPFLAFFGLVHDGEAACGTALRQRRRVIVDEVAESPIFLGTAALEIMLEAGVRAVQSTPLFSNGRLLGVLSTHYRRPRAFADGEMLLFDRQAQATVNLIERCQLVD